MIISVAKKREEVISSLKDVKKVFLVGCGECASLCGTGDENAIAELSADLEAHGIQVTGSLIPKTGCQVLGTKREIKAFKETVDAAEALICMSCGAGTQTLSEIFEDKPVITANDTKFLGNMFRFRQFDMRCSMCGQCILNETGGICPVTRCPKGLLNGPCGGVNNGKCEVFPESDCIWVVIYNRMEKIGRLKDLEEIAKPKDYNTRVKMLNLTGKE